MFTQKGASNSKMGTSIRPLIIFHGDDKWSIQLANAISSNTWIQMHFIYSNTDI